MSTQSTLSKRSASTDPTPGPDTQTPRRKRMTVPAFAAAKGGEPLVCLTAYTAHVARLCDETCDMLLVGDSLGMVIHGMPNTLGVTLEHMIMHGQAVTRGAERALVVVDMPFGSFEESPEIAFRKRRPRREGDGLRRGEARGRARNGADHRSFVAPRRACLRPCRADAAGDEHDGRFQGARPRRGGLAADHR